MGFPPEKLEVDTAETIQDQRRRYGKYFNSLFLRVAGDRVRLTHPIWHGNPGQGELMQMMTSEGRAAFREMGII